ncbi:hypothetical protein O3P69_013907 [Scylla paramamosain]|uniref:Uncharacterized protein n=1 Tax=Scylla paramamosain TaxID=85552 RepID=A0AAW0SQY6_SCYPA
MNSVTRSLPGAAQGGHLIREIHLVTLRIASEWNVTMNPPRGEARVGVSRTVDRGEDVTVEDRWCEGASSLPACHTSTPLRSSLHTAIPALSSSTPSLPNLTSFSYPRWPISSPSLHVKRGSSRLTLTFLEEWLCQDHADKERESQDHHRRLAAHDGVDAAALVESESGRPGSAPVLLVRPQESECRQRVWWREVLWQELWKRHPRQLPRIRCHSLGAPHLPTFIFLPIGFFFPFHWAAGKGSMSPAGPQSVMTSSILLPMADLSGRDVTKKSIPGADDWFSITYWVVYLPPTYGQYFSLAGGREWVSPHSPAAPQPHPKKSGHFHSARPIFLKDRSTRRSREGNGSASSPSSTSGGEDGWGLRGGSLPPRDAPGATRPGGGLGVAMRRTFDA